MEVVEILYWCYMLFIFLLGTIGSTLLWKYEDKIIKAISGDADEE